MVAVGTGAIEVEGLAEFTRGIKRADADLAKELTAGYREIARFVANEARSFAHGEGRMQGHFADHIVGRGDQQGAKLGLRGTDANAAFWGSLKRSGWYGAGQYRGSSGQQFPSWVGSSWEVGGDGGPLAMNPAIRFERDEIARRIEELVLDVYAKTAFTE